MRSVFQVAMLAMVAACPVGRLDPPDFVVARREQVTMPLVGRSGGSPIHPARLHAYAAKRRRAAQGKRGKRGRR